MKVLLNLKKCGSCRNLMAFNGETSYMYNTKKNEPFEKSGGLTSFICEQLEGGNRNLQRKHNSRQLAKLTIILMFLCKLAQDFHNGTVSH